MKHVFNIALAGNPNCGKTTIFNLLAGAHQHVGNYSGVTVERKTGSFQIQDMRVNLIDLPGIYSLSSASAEERVAFGELMHSDIDLILNVIDAGNPRRNLYLTTQLAELNVPMILVFNMADDAKKRGIKINYDILCHYFNSPYIEAVGSRGIGIEDLRTMIGFTLRAKEKQYPKPLDYGPVVTAAIEDLSKRIESTPLAVNQKIPLRCLAVKLLENDEELCSNEYLSELMPEVLKWRKKISVRHGTSGETFMTDCRYGMITGACREAITLSEESRRQVSDEIDKVVTNKYLGLPIFFFLMFLVFFLTFTCAAPLSEFLGWGFSHLGSFVASVWPEGWLPYVRDLVSDGVIGGVGGVLQFLPNILMLFLGIAFLEGTGYMARAAFVMDGFMHKFGLHGKSFIPMLLGFGCTVPAIMAARMIESKRDRLTTIMVLPLMSCGARLPIYALIIPAFFAARYQAAIMWLIYFIGVVLALFCAGALKSTLFKGEEEVFVMELPPYRMPTLGSVLLYMGERAVMYLKKAGTFILAASVILYLFNTLPGPDAAGDGGLPAKEAAVEADQALSAEQKAESLEKIRTEEEYRKLKDSVSGYIGRKIAVVMKPVGFDWKISSALIGAFAGKELFVSQLGILYSIGSSGADEPSELQAKIRQSYTPLIGFCIMLFCLVSMPCVGTFAVVARETGSFTIAVLQLLGLTLLAYLLTFLVYQIGMLL